MSEYVGFINPVSFGIDAASKTAAFFIDRETGKAITEAQRISLQNELSAAEFAAKFRRVEKTSYTPIYVSGILSAGAAAACAIILMSRKKR